MSKTPLMMQYQEMKAAYKDSLLLYRMGDFYELFSDDAVIASRVLGLTLTSRNQANGDNTPLAGFPYHSIEKHLPKLVNAGYKVAVCEQMEDPATAKGIVKRDVVEVITKGTTINDNCLEAKSNNFLSALHLEHGVCGLACLDLSTGMFSVMEGTVDEAVQELYRLNARETLFAAEQEPPEAFSEFTRQEKVLVTVLDGGWFNYGEALRSLTRQFKVHSLEAFGCGHLKTGVSAAGAILNYVKDFKKTELSHLTRLTHRPFNAQMNLDSATIRNLELIKPLHADDEGGTLFHLLDNTVTAMGGRKLKFWLTHPLLDLLKIRTRLDAVQELRENRVVLKNLRRSLRQVNDIERIVAKAGSKRANARDLLGLGHSLLQASEAGAQLDQLNAPVFSWICEILVALKEHGQYLTAQFIDNPPLTVREGGMLNPDTHSALKTILGESKAGKKWLSELEGKLKAEHNIPTLKVGYNKVFGYYIEVTRQHAGKLPSDYIRKQTLVNQERFITPEMKEWENKILNAEGKANAEEYAIFCRIREEVAEQAGVFLDASRAVARLDVLCSFAETASGHGYCRPDVTEGSHLRIIQGRHPVVESITREGEYIPNDVMLDTRSRQVLLMTGPNMSGKSTYLRQVGLITLMAQIGCFVPAESARIGLADRIFTRVGASDRLTKGQSTFMVEMIETASILHNATPRSLILLDEIGRGTSTFDGLSLAWAIVETIHENERLAARTLFATHYHELTELPKKFKRTVNIQVAVKEVGQDVLFLHKVLEGHCDSSYGIQVAGMAGVPRPVLNRAWEILDSLEQTRNVPNPGPGNRRRESSGIQGDLFSTPEPVNPVFKQVYDEILRMKLENMSPLEVMNKVNEIQRKYGEI